MIRNKLFWFIVSRHAAEEGSSCPPTCTEKKEMKQQYLLVDFSAAPPGVRVYVLMLGEDCLNLIDNVTCHIILIHKSNLCSVSL